jgi:hypothetical protein
MFVVLNDSDHCGYNLNQVNVVPISEAESAKRNGKLLPSHILLKKDSYEFINKDCYICTHQSIPINRAWLLGSSPKGRLKKKHIKKMDLGLMHSLGLLETLLEFKNLPTSTSEQNRKQEDYQKINSKKNIININEFFISTFNKKKKNKKKAR